MTWDPRAGVVREMRAAGSGLLTVLLAVGGHALAGGEVAGVGPVLAVTGLSVVGAIVATRRRVSLASALALLAGAQVLVHVMVSGSADSTGHHGTLAASGGHLDAPMLAAHAVATILAALALRFADAAVHAVARAVRRPLPGSVPCRPELPRVLTVATSPIIVRHRPYAVPRRRGPPVVV